jgi:type II secretory pathway component PulF
MLFTYQALDQAGAKKEGSIEAVNVDVAISSLQRRGFVITSIHELGESNSLLNIHFSFMDRVSNKDVVILSRQLATLFQAQVSALRIFRLLSEEAENKYLGKQLADIADDLQGGSSISAALAKHPKIFSEFYVNMVKSGEESGKLDETFNYLADYLDRTYELVTKARGALVYPSFIILTFVVVMVLMFTLVIPKISAILVESGQDIPFYTKIVLGISNFLLHYGFIVLAVVIVGGFFLGKYVRTDVGRLAFDTLKLKVPYIGNLFRKLYLSRIADNMNTMLISGIPMVRALELTSTVINNVIYRQIISNAVDSVKGGKPISEALSGNGEVPGIMIQMMKVGEETGELGNILKTLANFYSREVRVAVDALVDVIEPAMIVLLGVGVATLLASVLIPIYNVASSQ